MRIVIAVALGASLLMASHPNASAQTPDPFRSVVPVSPPPRKPPPKPHAATPSPRQNGPDASRETFAPEPAATSVPPAVNTVPPPAASRTGEHPAGQAGVAPTSVTGSAQTVIVPASNGIDGVYTGSQHGTRNNNSGYCINMDGDARVMVKDGVITRRWGSVALEATVGTNGTFSANKLGGTLLNSLNGRISGGSLEADIGNVYCAAHLSLKRQ
jgi:hypothetical protein